MPRLPHEAKRELVEQHGLTPYDAEVLTSEKAFLAFFEEVFAVCQNARSACSWVTSELFGLLNKNTLDISASPISPASLGALIKLLDTEVISGKMAKSVFEEMFATGKSPDVIVKEKGLKQITNDDEILKAVVGVFDANAGQLKGYLEGNDRLHGFFVGLVMKATGGSANPKKVNELIAKEVARRKAQQGAS